LGRAPIWFATNLSLALNPPIRRIATENEAARYETPLAAGKRVQMKFQTVALSTLILLAASVPVAAKKNAGRPLFLESAVTMNGAEIPEGMYDLTMESSNANVRVTLWKNGQFVATASGVWVKGGMKYKESAFLLRVNSDGSRSLVEIRLAGSAKTIVLNDSGSTLRFSPN
jgi:hypothetical protein